MMRLLVAYAVTTAVNRAGAAQMMEAGHYRLETELDPSTKVPKELVATKEQIEKMAKILWSGSAEDNPDKPDVPVDYAQITLEDMRWNLAWHTENGAPTDNRADIILKSIKLDRIVAGIQTKYPVDEMEARKRSLKRGLDGRAGLPSRRFVHDMRQGERGDRQARGRGYGGELAG